MVTEHKIAIGSGKFEPSKINEKYAPNIITSAWAKFTKNRTPYTILYPNAIRANTDPKVIPFTRF
ncbi:hypothetical protein RUMHYD_02017 [Blautia hydrogenotrophica DSM 10507]|uniref:Uncharacterized protein n=1 Tax=Blautia hydrogenotrophica (strain DSM 10507 / JCM 14656 / S5a33) TaxID=476272 RepID=C0CMD5_BLAHS|nr:hypothetical protein RUMHYD_02017 [Blautia hydrogenotrophica DSM 10507]